MKAVLALAVFACLAAMAMADYGYNGLRRGHRGVYAPFNNKARQEAVNAKAEEEGAGTGTAEEDGVPGTGNNFGYKYEPYYGGYHGYRAPFHHGGYGYGGFGYAGPYGYPY